MIRLGITGGIGSGKSTAAQILARWLHGAVVDADAISRQSTASGGSAIPEITRIWGSHILAADGGLNRPLARQRAFEDPTFRQTLESIIHPLVHQEIARTEMECARQQATALIYDIPLLVESGQWRSRLDQIVVVDCSEETQIQRVQARNQIEPDGVRAIIHAQASRRHRLASADIVICNDRISLLELDKQCQQVSNILVL